jgi:predicted GNAT superfamily acetyltransferase
MPTDDPLALTIRPLDDAAECQRVEDIQLAAWGREPRSVTPAHVVLTAAHNGGVVLGAFHGGDAPECMIGFTWGFLGTRPGDGPPAGRLKLCSHQTGVLPEWQGRGVAFALKQAQRDAALAHGLDLVTWTYDPLEARNAQLNIAKLGAVCNTYRANLYGDGLDGPSSGLPTDRFQVDWWIASPRAAARAAGARPVPGRAELAAAGVGVLNEASLDESGVARPPDGVEPPHGPRCLVEVPAHFQDLKRADLGLAAAWRTQVRQVLQAAFGAGYTVTDFLAEPGTAARAFYLLTRGADGPALTT